jgi:SAM-dependent methyltransferase
MDATDELIHYYTQTSKHSNYQILPARLRRIIAPGSVRPAGRFEEERLRYVLGHVDVTQASVLDIGSNSGFFTFELIDAGAGHVTCYEGNRDHARFVELAARTLNWDDRIEVIDEYFTFPAESTRRYDLTVLLNVLHHVGADYGGTVPSVQAARETLIAHLNSVSRYSRSLALQIGFNWQGDINQGLFPRGTKGEMIELVTKGIEGHWKIEAIGIAQEVDGNVEYVDVDERNVARDDTLGEFLNRPLFVLKSSELDG